MDISLQGPPYSHSPYLSCLIRDQFDESKAILISWSQNRSHSICATEDGCSRIFVRAKPSAYLFYLWAPSPSFLSSPDVEHPWVWGGGFGKWASLIISPKDGQSCASPRFPFPKHLFALWCAGCWDPLDLCRQLWGREGSADGAPAVPLPGSVSHPCRAGTLNVAMVIKAHSPQLPRKRSTPQIRYTSYGPVNFPKRSLFVRFKQGFMLHPWKMLYCENTQQGSACALFFFLRNFI